MTVAQCIETACIEKGFSILNLNLRFGRADDGANSWPFRTKAYPPLFDAYPSDFYTFQEANDFQVDFLRRRPASLCCHRPTAPGSGFLAKQCDLPPSPVEVHFP